MSETQGGTRASLALGWLVLGLWPAMQWLDTRVQDWLEDARRSIHIMS